MLRPTMVAVEIGPTLGVYRKADHGVRVNRLHNPRRVVADGKVQREVAFVPVHSSVKGPVRVSAVHCIREAPTAR